MHVGLLAAAELREPWGGALLAEGVRAGHLRSSGELGEGAACRAGEVYQELAEEECRDPAARCWPGEAAVRELRSCAQELRSSCDACFPAPSPVQPRTRQLHEALRILAAPGAPAPAWSDAEVRLREATELSRTLGQIDEAAALLRDVIAAPLPGEAVAAARELLRDIEAHQSGRARC